MDPDTQHPAFDSEEQAILSQLRPEDEPLQDGNDVASPDGAQPQATDTPASEDTTATPAAAPAVAQAPAAEAPAAAPAAAPVEQPKPQGDTRAALRAARTAEKRLRDENEVLRRELEDARNGKVPVDTTITDEELQQLEQDFPLQAKLVRRQRELEEQLAATRTAAPPPASAFEPPNYQPETQMVIDSVPDLVAWQYDPAAQDKFQRAIEYDKALLLDPDWKGRTPSERFAEAAERTKRAFGAAPSPSAAPAAHRLDTAAALAAAPVFGPKGISDFRGGGPAAPAERDFSAMSDEEVMASLTPS